MKVKMPIPRGPGFALPAYMLACSIYACTAPDVLREQIPPESLRASPGLFTEHASDPFLKAHMKNGNLYVLKEWKYKKDGEILIGAGQLFGPDRRMVEEGEFKLSIDTVAIFETNVIRNSGAASAISVITGISLLATGFCLANPKACFGSCPTFYVFNGDSLRLQGEGFSASISPSLEATDIDALFDVPPLQDEVVVEMRNEALETHIVRHVDLLAVPRSVGTRVFRTADNRFREAGNTRAPVTAVGPEGSCLALVAEADGRERFSEADSSFLGAKEELNLEFNCEPGREYGLVVGCRQTLLPTYLLYQTFAYMGSEVGSVLAAVENGSISGNNADRMLGGIDVLIEDRAGSWASAGTVGEHGPLATDMHLQPIGFAEDSVLTVKLNMTQGTWRIDVVNLVELSEAPKATRLKPSRVLRATTADEDARRRLLDPARALITFPGDTYLLQYDLPSGEAEFELFVESRGYYLEWIREEWIAEENQFLLAEMILNPRSALTRLAPRFKAAEPQMEECFWRSRYAKP